VELEKVPEPYSREEPSTFLEATFRVLDSIARRIVDFMPLGRGVRNLLRSKPEGLIGWEHVREISLATLELQREKPEAISHYMTEQYQNMLLDAQRQVADYTGLRAEGLPSAVEVFGQAEWIDANIPSFQFLFEPISDKYVGALGDLGAGQAASAQRFAHSLLTIQVGIIMGYLSRNVLGQFDLSLPEPERGGRLYVVEPNMNRIQMQMGFDPREFRQWITLHEVTHSFEFHCNTWLTEHLSSSMQEYLKGINLRGIPRPDILRNLRQGDIKRGDAMTAGGLISIISTPEQREILSRLQAIMCVLEGYSNLVMDHVGKELLRTYATMKERFERRRETRSAAERLFQRLIGIELKLQQYRLGQAFAEAVVEKEGITFLNRVWQGPDNMPTMDEIIHSGAWIERMKQA